MRLPESMYRNVLLGVIGLLVVIIVWVSVPEQNRSRSSTTAAISPTSTVVMSDPTTPKRPESKSGSTTSSTTPASTSTQSTTTTQEPTNPPTDRCFSLIQEKWDHQRLYSQEDLWRACVSADDVRLSGRSYWQQRDGVVVNDSVRIINGDEVDWIRYCRAKYPDLFTACQFEVFRDRS